MSIKQKFEKIYDYFRFKSDTLIIEPTNKCNLACPICYKSFPEKNITAEGFMSRELLESILNKAGKRIKNVCLYFRGESLLHPDIAGFTKLCKSRGLFTSITTNGLLLNEKLAGEIIDAGLDKLIVDYDGISPDDYKMIRNSDKGEQVLKNILALDALKKKLNKKTPELYIKALDIVRNKKATDGFIDRLKKLNITGNVIISNYFPWPDIKLLGNFKVHLLPKPKVCPMYYQGLSITYSGNVIPCSYDYMEDISLGNINDYRSIDEIYAHKAYKSFRRTILFKKYDKLKACRKCLIPILFIFESTFSLN
ncbi:MAG: radical SAM protein [Elusimicrobiota bacterium]